MRVWDVSNGQSVKISGWYRSISFDSEGELASAGFGTQLWNLSGSEPVSSPLAGSGSATTVAYSRDGKLLAAAGDDGMVQLYNGANGAQLGGPLKGSGQMRSLSFSSDNKMLASASSDGTVRLWDVGRQALGQPLKLENCCLAGVAFSPDSKMLAVANADRERLILGRLGGGTVVLWDFTASHPVAEALKGHSDGVLTAAFSHN
jgi:WD40 repeat protein